MSSKMQTFIRSSITAAALAITVVGSAQAEGEKFIVVSHGQANDPFWAVVKNAVELVGAAQAFQHSTRS